jgi:hypothetical protein
MPSSRLEVTWSKDSYVFPLNRRNYDKLLNFFDPFHNAALYWNNALTRSDPHFEIRPVDAEKESDFERAYYGFPPRVYTLRLPPLHQTWSDISVVLRERLWRKRNIRTLLGLTTGLSQETFRQVHKSCHDLGDSSRGSSFIISLFQYLADEVANDIAHSRNTLKWIEDILAGKITTSATDTGPLRDLWIEQEVPLELLNRHLTGLIVSAGEARSRLEYISRKAPDITDVLELSNICKGRLTEVAFLEQRINTNISVVCHPSPNILSPELTTALIT